MKQDKTGYLYNYFSKTSSIELMYIEPSSSFEKVDRSNTFSI